FAGRLCADQRLALQGHGGSGQGTLGASGCVARRGRAGALCLTTVRVCVYICACHWVRNSAADRICPGASSTIEPTACPSRFSLLTSAPPPSSISILDTLALSQATLFQKLSGGGDDSNYR